MGTDNSETITRFNNSEIDIFVSSRFFTGSRGGEQMVSSRVILTLNHEEGGVTVNQRNQNILQQHTIYLTDLNKPPGCKISRISNDLTYKVSWHGSGVWKKHQKRMLSNVKQMWEPSTAQTPVTNSLICPQISWFLTNFYNSFTIIDFLERIKS